MPEKTITVLIPLEAATLFGQNPHEYLGYAIQWAEYETWSVEDAANLLVGCVPHRPLLLKGDDHEILDQQVVAMENRIHLALKSNELNTVTRKRYFGKTFLKATELITWAQKHGIAIPAKLVSAFQVRRSQESKLLYSTPCLDAIKWTIAQFWEGKALDHPPSRARVLRGIRFQFPDLTGAELDMVEHVCRPPVTGKIRGPGATESKTRTPQ